MNRHDAPKTEEEDEATPSGSHPNTEPSARQPNWWSPAMSPRARPFEAPAAYRLPLPLLANPSDLQRFSNASSSSSSLRIGSPAPTQPQAVLNMSAIQAKAEILEMQTRRDIEETRRLAERHFEEMLDSKGFRVTHACEHCRQRKAKCSGQQPCDRCAKQGIMCKYSKYDRKGNVVGQVRSFDVPSQSSRYATANTANAGPIRAEKSREGRYTNSSLPYLPRRNTAPCTQLEHLPMTTGREGSTSTPLPLLESMSFPPLPPPSRSYNAGSSNILPQPISTLLRPTPLRFSNNYELDERRDSIATDASTGLAYSQDLQMQQSSFSSDSPHVFRPWTTEPMLLPAAEQNHHHHTAQQTLPRPTSLPTRTLMQEDSWHATPSGLSTVWPGERGNLETSLGLSPVQRPALLPYRSELLQHPQPVESPYLQRHESWSTDGGASQEVRHGSVSSQEDLTRDSKPNVVETKPDGSMDSQPGESGQTAVPSSQTSLPSGSH